MSEKQEEVGAPDPVVLDPEEAAPAIPEPRVEVTRNDDENRYELTIDDHIAGYSEFSFDGDDLVVLHTETLPGYQDRGVASILTERLLSDARESGQHIIVKCEFVRGYLQKHPEWNDVVDG